MNRFTHILRTFFIGSCFAAVLVACSSDDDLKGYVPQPDTIEIVENNLTFTAQAGTATLQVGTPVQVSLDATWCVASVSGTVVTVSVDSNTGFEGRTALLVLTDGKATRRVPVQQQGMVLDALPFSDRYAPMDGDEFTYTLRHDMPMEVSTTQPWLHATLEGEQLHVTIDSNQDGHIRRGQIITESVGIRDTLSIAQYDLYNDIVGSYYIMGYYGGNTEQPAATRFDIVERNDSLFMHWTMDSGRYDNTYIYVPFDPASATLILYSNFTLFNQGITRDAGYFYDSDNYICSSSTAGASCYMYYAEQSGFNAARIRPYNWPGHDIYGFIIRSTSLVSSTLIQLSNIVIMRVGPVGTKI